MFKRLIQRFIPGGGAQMKLRPGDPCPAFECADHLGVVVSAKELLGRRFVLWFYPMADTPG
jgi:peroxiredoxin